MSGYPQELKYFMWAWQVHFKISCQVTAEGIFNKLDRGLRPNVFLVGLLGTEREDRLPVCVEPEGLEYSVDEFDKLKEVAAQIHAEDPDRNMMYSGPGMQEEMNERRTRKSIRLAIEKILNESPNNRGTICFASSAVFIEGFWVHVILELDLSIYESHIHLKKFDPEIRIRMYYSLLETAKDAYLKDREIALHLPEAGKSLSGDTRPNDEFLREAAKNFMYTVSWNGGNHSGLHGLFDACNKISTFRYEGLENFGELIVASKGHSDIEMRISVEEPFEVGNFRKLRKLLQLAEDGHSVITDSYLVYGVGRVLPSYDKASESVYRIKFEGTHCWDLFHADRCLMQMRYGLPQFNSESISKTKFATDARRIFYDIQPTQIDHLYELTSSIVNESKGAQLIISAVAMEESERLKAQCIKVQPVLLTIDLFQSLSSMDGGILIDLSGVVYAAGVILDGVASTKGNSARGSRYNSAIRYVEFYKADKPAMIVVISEDGMIDLVPDLMPQINRNEILGVIASLEQIASTETFDRSYFYKAMDWLANRGFYLRANEVSQINGLRVRLEELDSKSGHTMWRVFSDFQSNEDMNDSYYLPTKSVLE